MLGSAGVPDDLGPRTGLMPAVQVEPPRPPTTALPRQGEVGQRTGLTPLVALPPEGMDLERYLEDQERSCILQARRPDIAQAVLVLQLAFDHVAEDFRVAMRVLAESLARLHHVVPRQDRCSLLSHR